MMTIYEIAAPGLAAAHDLQGALQGRLVLPGSAAYSIARRVWNGAVDHCPALIVQCETAADVRAAIRAAREHGLPLAVRGGGRDWAGRSMPHQGLLIDLTRMRRVTIDAASRIATVAGGATVADVIAAAAPHGLVAAAGNSGSVGMAGLTLGGGYGPLTPRYGLALDNLLGAELVLADGRHVVADELEHSELFWALRGGGGNFGVVTAMQLRLHPISELLAGLILFPWSGAEHVLCGYAGTMAQAPDELAVTAGMSSGPDGQPAVFLAPVWNGAPALGEKVMARLRRLGTPIAEQIGRISSIELLRMYENCVPAGRHYSVQTRWLSELTPHSISALVRAGGFRRSPFSIIAMHHFHGAATRVPVDATAFGLRREHFLVEIVAAWEPDLEADDERQRRWARRTSGMLKPTALPGGYPTLLGPDESEQIASAYGGNAERLLAVKQRYDPEGVFTATPLPEADAEEADTSFL